MATIRQRDGRWQACVRSRNFPSVSKTFHRQADAARWARDVEVQQERGTYKPEREAVLERVTLADLLARYKSEVTPTKRSGDKEAYLVGRIVSERADLFARPACEIRPSDVAALRDAWLAEGYAPASVVRRLGLIGHCYELAIKEWDHGSLVNPLRSIRKPQVNNARARLISDDEIDRIITTTESPELPALVLLLADTAMRRGEALALVAYRVDFARNVARLDLTKNGKPREVPLSPRAAALLGALTPRADGRFFTFAGCVASGAWRRAVTRARECYEDECQRIGKEADPRFLVDLNMHDLRHTRLSMLAMAGLSPVQLMGISGHVTLGQLARYSHVQSAHLVERLQAYHDRDNGADENASAVRVAFAVDAMRRLRGGPAA